jgi:hypothetical protein
MKHNGIARPCAAACYDFLRQLKNVGAELNSGYKPEIFVRASYFSGRLYLRVRVFYIFNEFGTRQIFSKARPETYSAQLRRSRRAQRGENVDRNQRWVPAVLISVRRHQYLITNA